MAAEVKNNIFSVGVLDAERCLFDALIPLPEGTSYNSYLIKGSEKIALIDTVDPAKEKELLENLHSLGIDRIDYVVAHHGEQDHSGGIPTILKAHPMAKVVTNAKCMNELKEHLLVPDDKFVLVNDGDDLSLGDKTLKFIFTPWVHWPETMVTYVPEDKILFSCDFFGSHIGTSSVFEHNDQQVYIAAKRYFAEIMMPFRVMIKNNLAKIKDLPIEIVCPSHGPIHFKPNFIVDAYKDWTSDAVKNEVVLPYVSMHGSTAEIVNYLGKKLQEKGVMVKAFDLAKMDLGEVAMALVDAATVVIATPTVLVGPHPLAVYVTYLFNALRPKTKYASVIGSYGWGSKAVDQIKSMLTNVKVELIEPVYVKGFPKENDFMALDQLVNSIVEKHKVL